MNTNSYLCKFLSEHPTDWEEILTKEYDLRIRREGDFAIFNYAITGNFSNPIVQEARGIILDTVRLEVVCWPFRKFGNHTESYADKIDWSSARVQEKIDGSIVKLWYDASSSRWRFSTNKTVFAENAPVEGSPGLSYGTLIRRAENFKDIPFDRLEKDFTYIFELVSPETRVVIAYERSYLYHLGTRNNLTGEELETEIGIEKPKQYPLHSLEECIAAAKALNGNGDGEISDEGFVVVDGRWNRVKVKSLEYVALHHAFTLKTIGKRECVTLLLQDEKKILSLVAKNIALEVEVKFYAYRLAELCEQAEQIGRLAVNLYEEYGNERGAVAKVIAKHPLAVIGFKCLDQGKTGREVLLSFPIQKICSWLPDFEPKDILQDLSE